MPKSRVRRTEAYTPPPKRSARKRHSAPWVGPAMVVCFLIGVVWLSAYYITGGQAWGISALGPWNLAAGFAFIMAGFLLSTQWR